MSSHRQQEEWGQAFPLNMYFYEDNVTLNLPSLSLHINTFSGIGINEATLLAISYQVSK